MAGENTKLTLSFRGAPLLLALEAVALDSQVTIRWPKTLYFSTYTSKEPEIAEELKKQLPWLKRSYEQIIKNPNGQNLAPHILPYLSKVDITLHTTKPALSGFASRVKDIPLAYAKTVSDSLAKNLKISSVSPDVSETISGTLIQDRNPLRLIFATPINEMELGLSEFIRASGLSWAAGFEAWTKIDYEQKHKYLQIGLASGLEQVAYRLEVVAEPGRLNALVGQGIWRIESIQPPVPSHGYELPPGFNDGGMMEQSFDKSADLYGRLQAKSPDAAQLFCLWGHRQRAIALIDQTNLSRIASSRNPYVKLIHEKLAEKHPLLWESMGKLG